MSTNWLPAARTGQLAMARTWLTVLATKATPWRMTDADVSELHDHVEVAETALAKVEDKSSRTHVDSVKCNDAFKALLEFMRYMKNNFFNSPPRTDADLALLELNPHNPPSDVKPPLNVASGKTRPLANGLIELVLEIIGDMIKDTYASDYGYRVFIGVEDSAAAPGAVGKYGKYLSGPPASGVELGGSFFTRRKRDVAEFDEQDRGKKAWFAVRLENAKGQSGPWGPLFWTVIP